MEHIEQNSNCCNAKVIGIVLGCVGILMSIGFGTLLALFLMVFESSNKWCAFMLLLSGKWIDFFELIVLEFKLKTRTKLKGLSLEMCVFLRKLIIIFSFSSYKYDNMCYLDSWNCQSELIFNLIQKKKKYIESMFFALLWIMSVK